MPNATGEAAEAERGAQDRSPAPLGLAHLIEAAEALDLLRAKADEHDAAALAPRSRTAYDQDWRQFEAWCERYGLQALPAAPETLRLYVTDLAIQTKTDGTPRFKASSIERYVAAISYRHHRAGFGRQVSQDERVVNALAGIRRLHPAKPDRKTPLLLHDVVRLREDMEFDRWPTGVAATRDHFAILLGFATALRRSELAALDWRDVRMHPLDGLHITVRSSKSDQEGHGAVVGVPFGSKATTCAPCAYVRWLRLVMAPDRPGQMQSILRDDRSRHVCREALPAVVDDATPLLRQVNKVGEIQEGRLSANGLNEMLKRRLIAAGYDPRPFGFHSLRAGMVTQARRNGASAREVRLQTRHGSDAMVDVYDREFNPLTKENAVWKLGL